ncbi:MAG: endolytic transglycosylase MltG [Chloroflexi bacterium]|jgi:UPF0755 protein|nr:endolytic transglycosylase MltG [Chloroflexota bacterium]
MKEKKGIPGLLIQFLLASAALVAFLIYANSANTKVLGSPGENVSLINNLRYSIRLYTNLDELQDPVIFQNEPERKFTIGTNDSATQVCENLAAGSFVFSSGSACDYLIYKGKDRFLSPGTYTIRSGLNTIQTMDLISNNANRDIQFTIFAGWRLEEIAAMIDQLGFTFSGEEFLEMAENPPSEIYAAYMIPEGRSLEGYLAPGFYSLKPTIDIDGLISEATLGMQNLLYEVNTDRRYQSETLSQDEIMILASIIQRETLDEAEMPLIASVFYNRLAIGMKLETDPTVQYGIGFDAASQSWWKTPLTFADLEAYSDYNTYQNQGLPPGPICNPGKAAISAATHPDQSDYFFFRAKCDGSLTHNFAKTYDEHLANGCD